MYKTPNLTLLEPISHQTHSRPFSMHHIMVDTDIDLVLYLHWHNEMEFFYVESGETLFLIEDKEYHLQAKEAIFIPPNRLHMAKRIGDKHCEFYAIVFSPSTISDTKINLFSNGHMGSDLYTIYDGFHLGNSLMWQKDLLDFLKSIFLLYEYNIDTVDLEIRGYLMIIWQRLYNNYLSQIKRPENYNRLCAQLNNALNYIHDSYDTEITLNDLANIANFSREQFCRSFKLLTGTTPFNYLNRYRIIKSCEYLINTSKKITDIAVLCGFNNISYYNRVFSKFIKMSPKTYRKIMT